MHVEVGNQDAVELEAAQGFQGGECDVGVDAEAHAGRGQGVVSRRADQAEGALEGPCEHRTDGTDGRAGGEPSGVGRTRRQERIGVEHAAAIGVEHGHAAQVLG